jgi:hypothetical protein
MINFQWGVKQYDQMQELVDSNQALPERLKSLVYRGRRMVRTCCKSASESFRCASFKVPCIKETSCSSMLCVIVLPTNARSSAHF